MRHNNGYPLARYLALVGTLLLSLSAHAADNMRFHGALVAEPCVIPPGEEEIKLDFGTVIDKYLYLNQRTHGQSFQLHLTECDLSLGNMLKITFSGMESPALPGLLALDGASQASGIAIGMETADGQALPLNKSGQGYPLLAGDNVIELKAFVQGEPQALANQSIERGPFQAVATFSLEYE